MPNNKNFEIASEKFSEVSGGEGTAQGTLEKEATKHLNPPTWSKKKIILVGTSVWSQQIMDFSNQDVKELSHKAN